jgi:hypothetical protein
MNTPIRINMVVTQEEHPVLYSSLAKLAPKARASVLRQHAEFGMWIKKQQTETNAVSENINQAQGAGEKAKARAESVKINDVDARSNKNVALSVASKKPSKQVSPAQVQVNSPVIVSKKDKVQYIEENDFTEDATENISDVLDASVLNGVDFGDLD